MCFSTSDLLKLHPSPLLDPPAFFFRQRRRSSHSQPQFLFSLSPSAQRGSWIGSSHTRTLFFSLFLLIWGPVPAPHLAVDAAADLQTSGQVAETITSLSPDSMLASSDIDRGKGIWVYTRSTRILHCTTINLCFFREEAVVFFVMILGSVDQRNLLQFCWFQQRENVMFLLHFHTRG